MSDSSRIPSGQDVRREPSFPRAVIHKRILTAAASQPDAPLETIADAVSGASADLVERVLEEYGDPARSTSGVVDDDASVHSDTDSLAPATLDAASDSTITSLTSESNGDVDRSLEGRSGVEPESDATDDGRRDRETAVSVLDRTSLTQTQLATLEAIAEEPTATQAALADRFDVTAASINQRLRSIDGFDWAKRRAFVAALFDSNGETDATRSTATTATTDGIEAADGGSTKHGTAPEPDRRACDSRSSVGATSSNDGDERLASVSDAYEDLAEQVSDLTARVDRLERQFAARDRSSAFADPELAHKVARACFDTDRISEDEEVAILRELLSPSLEGFDEP